MQLIQSEGAFDASVRNAINANFQTVLPTNVGNVVYCDPLNGYDGFNGQTPQPQGGQNGPVQSLAQGYSLLREGKNDVLILMGNGLTSASARIVSTFTWAKDAAHLIGVSSGVNISNRSRIAPTAAGAAFTPFFVVSGSGCLFSNIAFYDGFATGTTSQICLQVTGGRNLFQNCSIAGMADAASAGSAGSRSLLISGTGENQFVNCSIGVDTVSRGATNTASASVEFAAGTPRNVFTDCIFLMLASTSYPLFLLAAAAASLDRFQLFTNCAFINAIQSTGVAISEAISLHASAGGMILLRSCTVVGATKWGDTAGLAQSYVDGGAPTANATGLAVNPS